MTTADHTSMVGALLGDTYRITKLLGAGGMGEVYLAEHQRLPRPFAIKVLSESVHSETEAYRRFRREAEVCSRLRHPNIVDVFDWSLPDPGRQPSAYVVMELLEGESLQGVLRRRNRIPPGMMIRIMLQVLDGVAAVHAQGIVHRDLSPANIFLVKTPGPIPRVKILDFGLAKGLGHTNADSAVTQPGSVLGRAAYAAPEIFGEVELDTRADIFACGMILFRALAGRFQPGADIAQLPGDVEVLQDPGGQSESSRKKEPRLVLEIGVTVDDPAQAMKDIELAALFDVATFAFEVDELGYSNMVSYKTFSLGVNWFIDVIPPAVRASHEATLKD